MIIVLDTNVLVSGLLSPYGPPARVVDQVISTAFRVAFDDRILTEYDDVLRREKFGFEPRDVQAVVDHIRLNGVLIAASPLSPPDLPDPTDLPFAEVAMSADADMLVTGNIDHFDFAAAMGVRVVTPVGALQILAN